MEETKYFYDLVVEVFKDPSLAEKSFLLSLRARTGNITDIRLDSFSDIVKVPGTENFLDYVIHKFYYEDLLNRYVVIAAESDCSIEERPGLERNITDEYEQEEDYWDLDR